MITGGSPGPLRDRLLDARRVELELIEGVPDALLPGRRSHFLEPPIWEMGHVGWFQEFWLLRHLEGSKSLLDGSDRLYDPIRVSYKLRWDAAYPSRQATRKYIDEVLQRSLARLSGREATPEQAYFFMLADLHETMHAENLTLILHTLGGPRPRLTLFDRAFAAPPVDGSYRPRDVRVPGGVFELGASKAEPFVFDNEKWAHPVEVKPFQIASTPVTNADYAAFVGDGGYRRREVWSRAGWEWKRREDAGHPLFWVPDGSSSWCERDFDDTVPLRAWHPVTHVNWYEADAYCRWAGRRLPTEAEWEMSAVHDPASGRKRRFPWGDDPPTADRANLDYRAGGTVDVRALPAGDSPAGCRQMIGNVWEWVADTFQPYPGFECDPYAEYSQPYFGHKKVLKGGAWLTRSRLIRSTWRNFYMRHRRNAASGFRTCVR